MFYACFARFDVTENLVKFWVFLLHLIKQGPSHRIRG